MRSHVMKLNRLSSIALCSSPASHISALRAASSAQALNSSGIPASLFSPEAVESRHEKLRKLLSYSGTFDSTVQPRIKALLVDAAGTLIKPSEPAAAVYLRYAAPYGCKLTEGEILQNFRRAFSEHWTQSTLRYEGDARIFWRYIVGQATGCDSDVMHNAVYNYFARAEAWTVEKGAVNCLQALQSAGFRLAVVSNFDTRLRQILDELCLTPLFDSIVVSAEVGVEKPNPVIFETACRRLGVKAPETLVLGDDRRNDVTGGRAAGCNTWLFGVDVEDFAEVSRRLQSGTIF